LLFLTLGGTAIIQSTRGERQVAAGAAVKLVNRLDFADDYQASSSYRRQLATVLISSVLDAAYEDALAKEGKHGVDQG
jgi:CO/xanthine dehydrogenase FAD-binding subunit